MLRIGVGVVLVILGIAGYFYCSEQLVPLQKELGGFSLTFASEELTTKISFWEFIRIGAVGIVAGGIGLIIEGLWRSRERLREEWFRWFSKRDF